jgi:hypothetical protein
VAHVVAQIFFCGARRRTASYKMASTSTSTPAPDMLSDDEENDPFVALENIIISYNLARQKKASATVDTYTDTDTTPTKRQRRDVVKTQVRFTHVDKAAAEAFSKHTTAPVDKQESDVESSTGVSNKALKYAAKNSAPTRTADNRAQESNLFSNYSYLLYCSIILFQVQEEGRLH